MMGRLSPDDAARDGESSGRSKCVFCGLKFTEVGTLHRHIRQDHREENKKK